MLRRYRETTAAQEEERRRIAEAEEAQRRAIADAETAQVYTVRDMGQHLAQVMCHSIENTFMFTKTNVFSQN